MTDAPGTLSMTNTGRPNSGEPGFFIITTNNAYHDWFSLVASKHLVSGKITDSMNMVKAKGSKKTQAEHRLVTPVKVNRITIEE
jgi:cyclophilin family peptidyl-prolyl cis-trans isomerase